MSMGVPARIFAILIKFSPSSIQNRLWKWWYQRISKAHNKELSSKDPTSHAEILCIRKACKKLNQKRLDGLIMITYLEPCNMCKEVIKSARIKEVRFIFINQNPSRKTIKKILYQKLEINEENLVKIFFKKKRIKN